MDTTKLEELLEKHEGYRQFEYKDSLGFSTIGIGRCIQIGHGPGLSHDESIYLLRNDIYSAQSQLSPYLWYTCQDDVRKCALIELCFNLGIGGLLEFKHALAYMGAKDYLNAAKAFLDSKWALEVGERAKDISYRIEFGAYRA